VGTAACGTPLLRRALARIRVDRSPSNPKREDRHAHLLKVQMEVEAGNRAIRDGSLAETLDRVMGQIQPEAAYFTALDGKRTALIFFDLEAPSQIPSVAEPFFMGLDAAIEIVPAMNAEDVRTGIEEASKAF
jgi:hypothetical protein